MIDNFEKIRGLLSFKKDTYYFLQVIQRRKDKGNEGLFSESIQRYTKYITNLETLDKIKRDVQEICNIYNARAYIELNPRSLKKYTFLMSEKLLERQRTGNFTNVYSIPNQVALSEDTVDTKDLIPSRRWLLDIDDFSYLPEIEEWVKTNDIKVVETLPTVSGYHMCIESFNYKKINIDFEKEIKLEKGSTFCMKPNCNVLVLRN